MNYVDVAQAITMPGLRLVLSPGGPGPWSEAAKSICHVKKLSFVPVAQDVGGPNSELSNGRRRPAPRCAAWNDERPRSTWIEQLYLFERLAPEPRLIPERLEDRVLMFGYSNEICGETGLGWSRRMMMFARSARKAEAAGKGGGLMDSMAEKYGYQAEVAQAAPGRVAEIIGALAKAPGGSARFRQPLFHWQSTFGVGHLLGYIFRNVRAAGGGNLSDVSGAQKIYGEYRSGGGSSVIALIA